MCPKCLVVVDEDDIGERVCPRCKSRLCPNAHIVEARICIWCGWEDPNYYLWQKRQREIARPSHGGQSAEYHAAKSSRICPKCGVDAEPGARRCANCGWLFPPASGMERTAPAEAPSSVVRHKTSSVPGLGAEVPPERQAVSVPRSPMLAEVGTGRSKWRDHWHDQWRGRDFSSLRRLFRPVGAGLVVLCVLVPLVWGLYLGGKYVAQRIGGGSEGSQPVPEQPVVGGGKVYPFSPNVVPPDGGTVRWSPEGNAFEPGTRLVLFAEPAECYVFDRWEGIASQSAEVTIDFEPQNTVTAYFRLEDKVPPVITGVRVTRYSDVGATIVWRTDEPARGRVRYGLTSEYGMAVEDKRLATDHVVNLTGLSPGKTYYFEVSSQDKCGNESTVPTERFTTLSFVAVGYSVGERAPDFTLPSYKDNYPDSPNNPRSPYYIGDQVTLSQFRGKWVFLNLWSTFCAACLGEFPHIREFYEDRDWANRNSPNAEYVVLTVCIDGRVDRIVNLEEKYKYQVGLFTFPMLVDDTEKKTLTELYRIIYVPTSVIIDPDGIIRAVKREQFKGVEELIDLVRSVSSSSQ